VINISHLTKEFRSGQEVVRAMDDLSLTIEDRSFFTLLGPSGCGKTTLLRCIAGLETPTVGRIEIGGKVVFCTETNIVVPPNKRNIGMVFQSYAIWPHMTVFKNVAYPLEVRNLPNVRERVMKALEMVELAHLADRYASKLSGGQQQRIALARAIVAEPDVLLLDEPLSNLDAALRETMRAELRKLQRHLNITTIYVTHDQTEALSMSDRIAVMRTGRFMEIATPEELYHHPKTPFAAEFIGGANVIAGQVSERRDGGLAAVETAFGEVWVNGAPAAGQVNLFIRPEKVVPADVSVQRNQFTCTLVSDLFIGEGRELDLRPLEDKGNTVLRCRTRSGSATPADGRFAIRLPPEDITVLVSD
jgi:iron(III) transport system ATP-binding protein